MCENEITEILQPRVSSMAKIFLAELRAGSGQQLDSVSFPKTKKPAIEAKEKDILSSGMGWRGRYIKRSKVHPQQR